MRVLFPKSHIAQTMYIVPHTVYNFPIFLFLWELNVVEVVYRYNGYRCRVVAYERVTVPCRGSFVLYYTITAPGRVASATAEIFYLNVSKKKNIPHKLNELKTLKMLHNTHTKLTITTIIIKWYKVGLSGKCLISNRSV